MHGQQHGAQRDAYLVRQLPQGGGEAAGDRPRVLADSGHRGRVHRGIAVDPPARSTPRQNSRSGSDVVVGPGTLKVVMVHISRAGLPPHRARAGMSSPFMRKESGASTEPSPMVTP